MLAWTDVTLVYAVYLAALAWILPRFARARTASLTAASITGVVWWWWPGLEDGTGAAAALKWVIIPSLALLGTYRASGAFFLRPSPPLERVLLSGDVVLLHRSGVWRAYCAAWPGVPELFELFYLLVYATVPLGATALLIGRQEQALPDYWTVVFVAELVCYAALPWLQSRPPRAIEPPSGPIPGPIRQLNLWLLRHGSIQVNTVPSAHAAGAVAVALGVAAAMPAAGMGFLVAATGITLATVLGRYHYAIDSMLGVAVAVVSWAGVRGLGA